MSSNMDLIMEELKDTSTLAEEAKEAEGEDETS